MWWLARFVKNKFSKSSSGYQESSTEDMPKIKYVAATAPKLYCPENGEESGEPWVVLNHDGDVINVSESTDAEVTSEQSFSKEQSEMVRPQTSTPSTETDRSDANSLQQSLPVQASDSDCDDRTHSEIYKQQQAGSTELLVGGKVPAPLKNSTALQEMNNSTPPRESTTPTQEGNIKALMHKQKEILQNEKDALSQTKSDHHKVIQPPANKNVPLPIEAPPEEHPQECAPDKRATSSDSSATDVSEFADKETPTADAPSPSTGEDSSDSQPTKPKKKKKRKGKGSKVGSSKQPQEESKSKKSKKKRSRKRRNTQSQEHVSLVRGGTVSKKRGSAAEDQIPRLSDSDSTTDGGNLRKGSRRHATDRLTSGPKAVSEASGQQGDRRVGKKSCEKAKLRHHQSSPLKGMESPVRAFSNTKSIVSDDGTSCLQTQSEPSEPAAEEPQKPIARASSTSQPPIELPNLAMKKGSIILLPTGRVESPTVSTCSSSFKADVTSSPESLLEGEAVLLSEDLVYYLSEDNPGHAHASYEQPRTTSYEPRAFFETHEFYSPSPVTYVPVPLVSDLSVREYMTDYSYVVRVGTPGGNKCVPVWMSESASIKQMHTLCVGLLQFKQREKSWFGLDRQGLESSQVDHEGTVYIPDKSIRLVPNAQFVRMLSGFAGDFLVLPRVLSKRPRPIEANKLSTFCETSGKCTVNDVIRECLMMIGAIKYHSY